MSGAALEIRESTEITPGPNEGALARLWRNAGALSEALRTEDGRRFRVIYPGRGSARAGPDFRDSVIAMKKGELLTGDVELHVAAPDWDSHHHDVDPNYNGVILHVVFYPKGRVASAQQSGTRAPVASVATAAEALGRAEGGRLHLPGGLRGWMRSAWARFWTVPGTSASTGAARGSRWSWRQPTPMRRSTAP